MKQNTAFKVGVVSSIFLIFIAALIIWKSDVKFRTTGYKLVGEFQNVGGLIQGADIRYRGYRVGRVSDILPEPGAIKVNFWVKRSIKIPKGSRLKILFDGLVGENYIGIEPNVEERHMLSHGDMLVGTSASDLANFIDLGSQNLIHAEAILNALRDLLTSSESSKSFKNILANVDSVSSDLSDLLGAINHGENSQSISEIIRNIHLFTTNLAQISRTSSGNASLAEHIQLMGYNFTEMSRNLKEVSDFIRQNTDADTISHFKSTLENLDQFTESLSNFFPERVPDGKRKSGNLFKSLLAMQLKTDASIQYEAIDNFAYYNAGFNLDFGRHFLRTGVSDREGDNKFMHLQHGVHLSRMVTTRVGLFYNKPGVGLDYRFGRRFKFSMEFYNLTALETDFLSRYSIRNEIDLMLGLRKNRIDKRLDAMNIGLSYHF